MSDKIEHNHDSEDSSPEEEKPLKKARYIWEVCGKPNLNCSTDVPIISEKDLCSRNTPKKTDSNSKTASDSSGTKLAETCNRETETPSFSSEKSQYKVNGLEGDQKESFTEAAESSHSCIGNLIAQSSDAMDRALQVDIEQYSSNDENDDRQDPLRPDLRQDRSNSIEEEYMILKWQARQIARGYVDNTINTMLETEMYEQHEDVQSNPNVYEDARYDPQHSLECEAIFEAIKTHGLQSSEADRTEAEKTSDCQAEACRKSNNCGETSSSSFEGNSTNRPPADTKMPEALPASPLTLVPNESSNISLIPEQCSGTDISESSSEPPPTGQEESPSFNCDLPTDAIDFLTAAVSAAIQKKGLTCG